MSVVSHAAAQVSNDAYANPSWIGTVSSGHVLEGSYEDAGIEEGEKRLYGEERRRGGDVKQSVWFTFSVPSDGMWRVTCGYPSDWAPVSVSHAMVLDDVPLAEAEPFFSTDAARRAGICGLRAGRVYRLGLRSGSVERSFYEVRFERLPAPPNDAVGNAEVVEGLSLVIRPTGATLEEGEVPGAQGEVIGSVWVKWKAPAAGMWLLRTPAGWSEEGVIWPFSPAALFPGPVLRSISQPAGLPWNHPDLLRGFSIFAAPEVSQPMAVAGQGSQWILFDAEENQEFWIAGYERWYGAGQIALEFERASPHDLRENATELGSASAVQTRGHFLGASVSGEESLPAAIAATRTVWKNWSARMSGPVHLRIQGEGSGGLPAVAVQVFRGEELVGGAVDGSGGREWRFDAGAGESYDFRLSAAGESPVGYEFWLLAGEAADDFEAAVPLDHEALVSTVGATLQAGEPAAEEGEGSVWLAWHSDRRQVVSVSLQSLQALGHWHGTAARMEIYEGEELPSLRQACFPEGSVSAVFVAEADRDYRIRVLATEAEDGVARVRIGTADTGSSVEELLMEAGATLVTAVGDRDEAAGLLVEQAHAAAPEDPRVLLASAYLELKAAARTVPGRILAARLIPNFSNLLPVGFVASAEAGPEGGVPPGLSLEEFFVRFDEETWPHLATALHRLNAIPASSPSYIHSTLPVYPRGRGGPAGVITDAHDRRVIAAMILALRGGIEYLASLDGSVPAADFFGWLCDGEPSLESLLGSHPRFLEFGAEDRRFAAWLWFMAAATEGDRVEASFVAPSFFSSDHSLFRATDHYRLLSWLRWARSAAGPVETGWTGRVDLSRWLFGSTAPRELLPEVRGNRLRAYTTGDVSFAGLLPNATHALLHEAWASRKWLADQETLQEWLERHFPGASPYPDEDTDGDGADLLHEYAFGLSPHTPGEGKYRPDFRRVAMPDGAWRSELGFRRRIAHGGGHYRVSRSTNLVDWEFLNLPQHAEADDLPGFERLVLVIPDDPLAPPRAFFKVHYTPASSGGSIGVSIGY